jgi:hypothetical protein
MVDGIQSGDGYKCSCGFITDDRHKFLTHISHGKRKDGKDSHDTLGRCNILTGEITMPPYLKRSKEQLDETLRGRKTIRVNEKGKLQTIRTTDVLSQASEIRFVPRIFTCTYTPIMQAGLAAAVNVFHWRQNMPLENFLDTIIYYWFKEHGIQLAGYIVDDKVAVINKDNPEHSDQDNNVLTDNSQITENA